MHRLRFRDGVEPERVILSYYNSISFAFTEICGRSYGGGVLEVLPVEAGKIIVPILDNVPIGYVREILEKIDCIIRNGDDIETALDIVDTEILIKYAGIESDVCTAARNIWKKLQQRRLRRRLRSSS